MSELLPHENFSYTFTLAGGRPEVYQGGPGQTRTRWFKEQDGRPAAVGVECLAGSVTIPLVKRQELPNGRGVYFGSARVGLYRFSVALSEGVDTSRPSWAATITAALAKRPPRARKAAPRSPRALQGAA